MFKMVKVTNPNITTAEKEKCLAVVKKHGPVNVHIAVPMEIDEPVKKEDLEASKEMAVTVKSEVIDLTDEVPNVKARNVTQEDVKAGLINDISKVKLEPDNKSGFAVQCDSGNKNISNSADEATQASVSEGMEVQISVASDVDGVSNIVPTTAATTDVTKPLTIETKFAASPGPSSESTDTASEVGSCFSSPSSSTMSTSAQNSPNVASGERLTGIKYNFL